MMEGLAEEKLRQISQYLTTEHFTLQGARNGTISESNGRLGGFLTTVSLSIVALAFIAQVAELGTVFFVFSIVIFPILISVGIGTWIRLIQLGVADVLHVQAINRIRHFYLQVVPEAEPYFSYSYYDDLEALRSTVFPVKIGLEGLGSAAFQVAIVNSVLMGAFASIIAGGLFRISLNQIIVIGVIAMILGFGVQAGYSAITGVKVSQSMEIRFPSQEEPEIV